MTNTRLLEGDDKLDDDWDEVVSEEVLIAVPSGDKDRPFVFSGEVTDLYKYIFSDMWADHMYDEYPRYYWSDVHKGLKKFSGAVEIVVDMVYQFGSATEDKVREYMEKYQDEGHRFLIMPRTEEVSMACAWLRDFEIRPIDSL